MSTKRKSVFTAEEIEELSKRVEGCDKEELNTLRHILNKRRKIIEQEWRLSFQKGDRITWAGKKKEALFGDVLNVAPVNLIVIEETTKKRWTIDPVFAKHVQPTK